MPLIYNVKNKKKTEFIEILLNFAYFCKEYGIPNILTANNFMRRIYLSLFFILNLTFVFSQTHTRIVSDYISVDEGLSSNKVYDLLQDPEGYMWMGTSYGLCRFDGYGFENFYSLGYDGYKDQANMGNLYLDSLNNLLWARTAAYTYSCYDLTRKCFVDYSCGKGVYNNYRRNLFLNNGICMYDEGRIRIVRYDNGGFSCNDFTSENGSLPKGTVIRMMEDGKGNLWAVMNDAVVRIEGDQDVKTVVSGRPVSRGCSWKGNCYILTKDNHVLMYGADGKQKKDIPIPAAMAKTGGQNGNFIWNGKWVLFAEYATIMMDFQTGTFSLPADCQMSNAILLDEFDGNVTVSDGGTLYIFTNKGTVRKLDLMTGVSFTSGRNRKFTTVKGKDGRYYIASYGNGLFVYNADSDKLEHYRDSDERPLIVTNYLLDIVTDRSGCIWVSQEDAGIARLHLTEKIDEGFLYPNPGGTDVSSNHICMMYSTKDGTVMVSARDNKLYRLSPDTGIFTYVRDFSSSPFAFVIDRQNHTWVGTRRSGVFIDNQQYSRLDSLHYFPAPAVYDIAVDPLNRIWIATWEHGLLKTGFPEDGKLDYEQFLNADMNENRINDIDIDRNGRMWIATYNGIYTVDATKKKVAKNDFKCYNTQNGLLPFNEIHCMMVASDGTLWVGGMGTGALRLNVSDVDQPKVESVGVKQGLPNPNVYSFAEDKNGNVWVATEGKLVRLSKQNGIINVYELSGDIQSNIYSQNCAVQSSDGHLLFGTGNGIVSVDPTAVAEHKEEKHRPSFTSVMVNGLTVSQNREWQKYFKEDKLSLAHYENTLKIEFSSFDYEHIQSSMYQCYLEGYEKEWNEASTDNSVEYGNLPPGRYTFHLRSVDGGKAGDEETSMAIVIHQPWWNTWWAWLLYLAVAGAIAYYLYKNWSERFRLHRQVKLEKQLAKFRVDFFTSVAHEFRTPLSIITGAADKLQPDEPATVTRKTVQTVKRGANRLSQLVNQLMEFRKVDSDGVKLRVEEGDIIGFVRDIYQDFWNAAQQRKQTLSFTPFEKRYVMCFDKHIVDTVVYNLLSNAVKYTPEGGAIDVKIRLDKQANRVNILVGDNGPGISEERQAKMFKPFMQGDASPGGIGVGLYTSFRLAQKHKGGLAYDKQEKGSLFTFSIPSENVYTTEEFNSADLQNEPEKKERISDAAIRELMPKAINDYMAVVIEDDPDMLDLIVGELSVYYKCKGFSSGQTGLDGVLRLKPSIVVCDVSLGDMKGFDVVRKIKDHADTAHIPVIMLTGHGGESYQIKGYKAGADDYMVKPCNFNVLIVRMAQLIQWGIQAKAAADAVQEKAKQKSSQHGERKEEKESGTIITSRSDHLFLEKLRQIMAQHISDSNFSMGQCAQLMNMGRTKFYGRAKELIGMSPNKYLLSERMRAAAELLYTGDYTVSEVSYRVGIGDMSYFNKVFKATYGVNPSKYGK